MSAIATAPLRTIKLSGRLGREFGTIHEYAVRTVAEAVKAMCITIPGFEKFLMESKEKGMDFTVHVGRRNVGEKELQNPVGDNTIRIAPVLQGSKRGGILQIVAGVVLIAIGIFVQWWMGGAPNPISNYLYGAGISMIVGGVIQLLSPQPKQPKEDKRDNLQSYIFNGAVNVQAQGNPGPLLYGELFVGSAVISAGISADDNYVVPTSMGGASGPGGYRSGGSYFGEVTWRALNEL